MARRHRHLHRLTTTLFVVLSLLFSQLALASYVCRKQHNMAAMAEMADMAVGTGETWVGQLPPDELQALFRLESR